MTAGLFDRRDDIRYAARRLRKQPTTSIVSVATLACAIGAAAATWSLLSATLLNPLHVPDPDRLVQVGTESRAQRGPGVSVGFTYPDYVAIRGAAPMPVAAFGGIGGGLFVQTTGEATKRNVTFTSADFLNVLQLRISTGRFFTADEDRPGGPLVAVLSDRVWRLDYQANPTVVGRVIHVADKPVTIIGVMPRGFRGLELETAPAVYMPLQSAAQVEPYPRLYTDRPVVWWISLVGRLPDGIGRQQMQARLSGVAIGSAPHPTIVLEDMRTAAIPELARAGVRQFSLLLGTTVALLLAIGIATVGMLLVLRTEARGAELAACLALGASRARLAAGIAMEGLLLAAAGALLALPVSQILFSGVRLFRLPGNIRVDLLELSLDGRVLAGVAGAAALAVLGMTALVAAFGTRQRSIDVLRSLAGTTAQYARRRSRSLLVTAQVAVTLVLVMGAGLFARSVFRALTLNPGVDISRLVRTNVNPVDSGYSLAGAAAFFDALHNRLDHDPSIVSVATSDSPKFGTHLADIDGQPRDPATSRVWIQFVDSAYLRTIGLSLSRGRAFTADDRASAPPVAIASATLARLMAGDENVVGHHIGIVTDMSKSVVDTQIVGVLPDFRWGASSETSNTLYEPMAQEPPQPVYPGSGTGGRSLLVRASGDPTAAMRAVTAAVQSLDAKVRLPPMTTVEAEVLQDMAPQRFGMTVMGALGAIALLLTAFGTYVLAESLSTLRRREMGIRAALGAPRGQLQMLLLGETFRLVGAGLLLGFGLGWLGTGTIRAFLFEVEPFDPLVTAGVATLIVVLAGIISLRPALAAGRLDLARVLRED